MIRAGIVRSGESRAAEPRAGTVRGDDGGVSVLPSITLELPGSDVFPIDEFHARRGLVGGKLSRAWFSVTSSGVTRDYSFSHAGSFADPTGAAGVASHAGRPHRYVDLGAAANTAQDVVDACIAALALDGITATDGGAGTLGRRLLVIEDCSAVGTPPAVAPNLFERGMWGTQRDNWGTGAVDLNADGGTGGTGSVHLGNPSSQSGMSGRAGRVIGVYLWAHGGHTPRLGAYTGGAYSLTPSAMTRLREGVVATAIGSVGVTDFGGIAVEAAAFASSDNLWAVVRDNGSGGQRYRLHGETPEGRGDVGLSQFLVWDTTASASTATPIGATYTPTVNNTYGIYLSIGVIYELQDASGNYPADGSIDTWVGDQHPSATHGTQFQAGIVYLTGETTHQRFIYPQWANYRATQYQRAVTAIAADETTRPAMYGPWTSLTHPAGTAPDLLYDDDVFPTPMSTGWNTMTFSTPIELETAASSGDHLSIGANYVTTTGAPIATWELPVFLDASTGDNSWIDAWQDDRTTWHDFVIGASGSRALPSGQQEYRTGPANTGMPNVSSSQRYPATMTLDATDNSPIAIALERVRLTSPPLALAP